MTTTAHEDQFTAGTQTIQPVLQPYSTEAILRRNIAALEVALKQQTDRAEAAEAELLAIREDNHSMMLEIHNLRIARDELLVALKDAHQVLRDWGAYIPSSTIQEDLDMLGVAIANAEKTT